MKQIPVIAYDVLAVAESFALEIIQKLTLSSSIHI